MARKNRAQKPNKEILSRTLILMVVCGVFSFVVLGCRLYIIQIRDHAIYQSGAIEQQVRETTINASRGTIYDRNMNVLAQSATVETVYISPAEMIQYEEDKSMIASGLSEILGVEYDEIMKKWEDTESWYKTVAVKIEQELAYEVRAFKNEHDLKSVHIVEDTKRYYPYSNLASQIIGFVGTENTGLEGLEAKYNSELQGVNGRIVRATTATGTDMLYTQYEDYYDATDGNSLVLTLDSTIQYFLEKNLEQAIADYDIKNGGIAIAMEVDTGAILGMATSPGYDLNNYLEISDPEVKSQLEKLTESEYEDAISEALAEQWRNRAITDTYEPGSTFKIITLATALDSGAVDGTEDFYCGSSIDVLGRDDPVHCWDSDGHGSQTLTQATQHSCNVAFVRIAERIGAERFWDYLEAFGFFDITGIDMNGESGAIWWSQEVFEDPLNQSQLAAASFGQTFNITPLQMITAVSTVANGGNLMQPYVVQQILNQDGSVKEDIEPTVVRQVISEDTSKQVCEILEQVVSGEEGTGKNAYVAGYRIAGKTGTSEKVGQNSDDYMVSFVGFAPADDPQIAVLVILDSPSSESGIYISGGVMAAPVVGNIFADALPYLGVDTVYTDEEQQNIDISVPNVKSLTSSEAIAELEESGFSVRTVGTGETVTDQLPMANVRVAVGTEVIIYLGESKPNDTVVVPELTGLTYTDAREELESCGLFVAYSGVMPSSSTIVVSRQSVNAGNEVARGTVIEVTLVDSDTSIMETR